MAQFYKGESKNILEANLENHAWCNKHIIKHERHMIYPYSILLSYHPAKYWILAPKSD